jgi:hypothetical protein
VANQRRLWSNVAEVAVWLQLGLLKVSKQGTRNMIRLVLIVMSCLLFVGEVVAAEKVPAIGYFPSWTAPKREYADQFVPGLNAANVAPDGRGDGNRFAQVFVMRSDRNGDGKISKEEFRGPYFGFDQLDTNQNGFIEADEFGELYQRRLDIPRA